MQWVIDEPKVAVPIAVHYFENESMSDWVAPHLMRAGLLANTHSCARTSCDQARSVEQGTNARKLRMILAGFAYKMHNAELKPMISTEMVLSEPHQEYSGGTHVEKNRNWQVHAQHPLPESRLAKTIQQVG